MANVWTLERGGFESSEHEPVEGATEHTAGEVCDTSSSSIFQTRSVVKLHIHTWPLHLQRFEFFPDIFSFLDTLENFCFVPYLRLA